ncbi:MAG TPA: hypothetical protein VMW65_17555, partial [Chloroflexota bacterium]|nr:hypothetical protein [Chloroflexota bacterium]
DELVAVDPAAGEMRGFPRAIGLKDVSPFAGQSELDELTDPAESSPAGCVAYVNPNRLRPDCVRQLARPAVLAFPRYAAATLESPRRLSPAEAAYQLMARLTNGLSLTDRGFAATARLARTLPAYSFPYSDSGRAGDWFTRTMADPGNDLSHASLLHQQPKLL